MIKQGDYIFIDCDNTVTHYFSGAITKVMPKKSFYEAYKYASSQTKDLIYFYNEMLEMLDSFQNIELDKIDSKYYIFCFGDNGTEFGKYEVYNTNNLEEAKECIQYLKTSQSFFGGEINITDEVFE